MLNESIIGFYIISHLKVYKYIYTTLLAKNSLYNILIASTLFLHIYSSGL